MAMQQTATVVGVFDDRQEAQRAVRALKEAGFTESEIGIASAGDHGSANIAGADADETGYTGEGALTGAVAGAGVGALWGLGILAGVLPAIGPAIAGGTLAVLLSNAAAGAAAIGLAGGLIGLGIPKEEAEYYESEMKAGRTIVTVNAGARRQDAIGLIKQYGGYDMASRSMAADLEDSRSTAAVAASTSVKKEVDANVGQTVQAQAEKLRVKKSPVEAGDVTIRKEVHTEHKTVDVPVTREEVVIERRRGTPSDVSSKDIAPGQEIRIPVKEEQVHVWKENVVAEEVVVGKRQVQGTQRVDETLRKEEIKVDTHGDVKVKEQRKS